MQRCIVPYVKCGTTTPYEKRNLQASTIPRANRAPGKGNFFFPLWQSHSV